MLGLLDARCKRETDVHITNIILTNEAFISIETNSIVMLLPTAFTASRLFVSGATIGPLIDGLHNQVLLQYDFAPLVLPWDDVYSLQTSWVVPPLLGVSYIILGSIVPNAVDAILQKFPFRTPDTTDDVDPLQPSVWLPIRAVAAVLSTAAIVKWTEVLLTNTDEDLSLVVNASAFSSAGTIESYLLLLITVCIVEWAWLDGTMTALLVASLAAVLGPLAELPFLQIGWWHYLDSPALYYPLGEQLGIHSLTGPCYFAVTMDAIALGRWFDSMQESNEPSSFREGEPLEAINGAAYAPEELVVKDNDSPTVVMAMNDGEPDAATEHASKG